MGQSRACGLWATALIGSIGLGWETHAPAQTRPAAGQVRLSEQPVVRVQQFIFEGNTQLDEAELIAAIDAELPDWRERPLAMEDLIAARDAVTRAYINAGYINSGAVIPDQSVSDGRILIRITEGRLTEIRLSGNRRLRQQYILSRVSGDENEALNLSSLRQRLELLRQDGNIDRVTAGLQPGVRPGEAVLDLEVAERSPYFVALQFDNYRSPSIGAERFELLMGHRNLTGNGDALSLQYGLTRGGFDEMQFSCFDDVAVAYALPLNANNTTLIISYARSDELVIEAPFDDLDIQSRTDSLDVTLRHPLRRTPNDELALLATTSVRRNRTELSGQPFSFSPGAHDGRSNITALRLGAVWGAWDVQQAIELRATVSFGIDAFGATINGDGIADSRFVSFLGQSQYIRRIEPWDAQLLLRGAVQLSTDSLMSIEQIPIGGYQTVRGYRQNAIVRDNGVVASAELRMPVVRRGEKALLTLAPFFDAGYGWNDDGAPDYPMLWSVGIGAILTPTDNLAASLYWGYALNELDDDNHDPQDHGLHFSLTWTLID